MALPPVPSGYLNWNDYITQNAPALAAEQATAWTRRAVGAGRQLQVVLYDWDKYGGRVLGDVIVDGQSVRQGLIKNGHAREYYGDKKKSWCP